MKGRFLAVAASLCVVGCTFLVKRDAVQCTTDADCTGRGAAFEGTTCNAGTCESNAAYCRTNQECIDRNKGAPFVCRKTLDHTCVALLTEACPRILGDPADLANDDTVVLGSMMIPDWKPILKAAEDSIELALKDLKANGGGLPPVNGSTKPRPVVVSACEIPLMNQGLSAPAVDHLVRELHVPAMIGPIPQDEITTALQTALATTPKTVIIAPSSAAGSQFTNVPGRVGVLFVTAYIGISVPRSTAQVVPYAIEPALRKKRGLDNTTKLHVATLVSGVGAEDAQINLMYDELVFNGATAASNGSNYKEFSYGDPKAPDFDTRLAAMLTDLLAFKPDIILFPLGGVETPTIFGQIEQLGLAPYYLFGTGALNPAFTNLVGSDASIISRIFVEQPGHGAHDPAVLAFYQRFAPAYPEEPPNELAALVFDSTYMAFFAAASVGGGPVTGDAMSTALFTRLNTGILVHDLPTDIPPAMSQLAAGRGIEFNGVEVPAAFDKSGNVSQNMMMLCVDPTVTAGALAGFRETGIIFDATQGRLLGTNGCF